MIAVRNKKHPHYPSGMVSEVNPERAKTMVDSGLWEFVDSAVVTKKTVKG